MSIRAPYYRQEVVNTILDNADLHANLTLWQGLHVCCWLMFNYNKVCLFCYHLKNGRSPSAAYLKTIKGEKDYYSTILYN
jgi:hypothetical protein